MYVYFYTLGCKVNIYETETIKQAFFENGFFITEEKENADIFVINSCTVTNVGDKKTKQNIRKFKNLKPDSIVAVLGCFPQAFKEEASKINEADIILGNANKFEIVEYVKEFLKTKKRIVNIKKHSKETGFEKVTLKNYTDRTRAFVKIQDGCNRYCTYCIIPKSRGFLKSKSLDDLKKEVKELAEAGFREIVLVGINLCFYGEGEDKKFNLCDAINTVAQEEKIKRIRLGSLEPEKITRDEAKEMSKIKKLCPQFHLSLQSGDENVLKRMGRHYSPKEYYEIMQNLKDNFENSSFTTDVIIGFPEETKDEFKNSMLFLEKCKFSKIHVFPYSIRNGTRAASMIQVSDIIKKQRTKIALELAKKLQINFYKTQINSISNILIEKKIEENIYEGYTENYTKTIINSNEDIFGKIVKAKITSYNENNCIAEII